MSASNFVSNISSGSIRLYSADEPAKASAESTWSAADQRSEKEKQSKVLIVDDQRLIADTLAEILGNAGFDAVAAYDGFDALDKASRFHPNWVLTDVLMPRMNGVELAIAMRKNYPNSAILLFSGQAGISEILQEGHRQGYQFELIAKPIHPMRLIERLKQD
ncbi:MAG TPA: response regulator [Terracidiphilus sp.]|jgi:PleD family two-component response regulator|nr:response regulator [Terracidiphilus sp.]